MAGYIINERALADINDIWLYTAENWSIEQADRYYNLIFDEIEYVATNSERANNFSSIRKGYKYSKVKSHLIFFREFENNIEVVRVLHERMDINSLL